MNNNQINNFIEIIKKMSTIKEVNILQNNRNYFCYLKRLFLFLETNSLTSKETLDTSFKNIINTYNSKYSTSINYDKNVSYYYVIDEVIKEIDIRLNKILNDEFFKLTVKKLNRS